jgi:hypothetical protein
MPHNQINILNNTSVNLNISLLLLTILFTRNKIMITFFIEDLVNIELT